MSRIPLPRAGVLQQRQVALDGALAAQRSTPVEPLGPHISADAMDELAEKLRRRQSAAAQASALPGLTFLPVVATAVLLHS